MILYIYKKKKKIIMYMKEKMYLCNINRIKRLSQLIKTIQCTKKYKSKKKSKNIFLAHSQMQNLIENFFFFIKIMKLQDFKCCTQH